MQVISKTTCTQEEFSTKQRDIFHDLLDALLNSFPDRNETGVVSIDHKLCGDSVEIVATMTYRSLRND
jgi:hypothetical protein